MTPPRLCHEFLHITRLTHIKCDNLRREECQLFGLLITKKTPRDYLISLSGQCTLIETAEKLSMIENRQNVTTVFVSSGLVT